MTLSPREREVATLVSEDLADKEIASILRISRHTVRMYLVRIRTKIGAEHSRVALRRAIARWVEQEAA